MTDQNAVLPTEPDLAALEVRRTAEGVCVLVIRREDRMNALDPYAAAALRQALRAANDDPDMRVLVLHGAGGNFCTGFDLKHKRVPGEEGALKILQDCFRILQDGRLPSIAAIEGNAFGAGLSLALACDQIIAGSTARMCAPFTGIGLVPDVGMAMTLERRVGPGRARRWMYEGTVVGIEEALSSCLADAGVPGGNALNVALEQAGRWIQRAPLAIAAVRRLTQMPHADVERVLAEELRAQKELASTEDHLEAVAAFREKRKPAFRGR